MFLTAVRKDQSKAGSVYRYDLHELNQSVRIQKTKPKGMRNILEPYPVL